MRIAICDDEPIIVNMIIKILQRCFLKLGAEAELVPFLSGSKLLEQINNMDAVFLDIEMPEMDGFAVGRLIRKKNPECRIIMSTAKIERFKESFRIQAFRFVTKPFDETEFKEVAEALVQLQLEKQVVTAYCNRVRYDIPQKMIYYIQAYCGYAEIFTKEETFRIDMSLNDIERLLDQRLLVRIHKTYIVGLAHILEYKSGSIRIKKQTFLVSRRSLKNVILNIN